MEGSIFSEAPSSSDYLIQFYTLPSGRIEPVAPIGRRWPSGFTVSPDGQWFVYSQADPLGSDLMLVENFR
jgi:hypothetical protein